MKLTNSLVLIAAMAAACQQNPSEPVETERQTEEVMAQDAQPERHSTQIPHEKGKAIVGEAAKTLLDEVMGAVYEEGPVRAVKYCNEEALGITARVAEKHGAKIKRTAIKLRNQANEPDSLEVVLLKQFSETATRGETPKSQLIEVKGKSRYFAPIMLGEVCVICHGNTNEMSPEVKETIAKLYPRDQATDFAIGDFRGMWSVEF